MNLFEKQLESRYEYEGKIINLRVDKALLPDGNIATREVVEHPGGVCVGALTDNDEILMVRQFRYPYGQEVLEVPAGKRDKKGEDPLVCGKRELLEETGAIAKNFIDLGKLYPSPGYCNEVIYLYAATDLSYESQQLDEDEFLECEAIPFKEVVNMVISGEIVDSKTIAVVLKIEALKRRGEI